MKKNELRDMRSKTLEELRKLIDTNKLELASFITKVGAKTGKDVKKAKNLRINIAQLLTLVREKEIIETEENKKKGKK
jgi:ribosomal protein L29